MAHATDAMGYPIDPELRRLEFQLGHLVGLWVRAYGDPKQQEELVDEYARTLARLYELGWDSVLDIDSELPDALLPEEYLRRTGRASNRCP